MANVATKQELQRRRHRRVRAKVKGTALCPRISVFRSNLHVYTQLIDDDAGRTLIAVSDVTIQPKGAKTKQKKDAGKARSVLAKEVGMRLAQQAKKENISSVVFDRGGYQYNGVVKAVAEGAREGGLKF